MNIIKKFPRNTAGRDFAVGDIHGHFTRLQRALDAIGFDPAADRLFSVGDLVDRGPESWQVLEWLAKPWFHPVRGNHEQMLIMSAKQELDGELYLQNGGAWFLGLPSSEKQELAAQLGELPLMIEVDTAAGPVGIVHANCHPRGWTVTQEIMTPGLHSQHFREVMMEHLQWDRSRMSGDDSMKGDVHDLRALVVGHTPVRAPAVVGNVWHIDTGGWLPDGSGYFTMLDLATLRASPNAVKDKLSWD